MGVAAYYLRTPDSKPEPAHVRIWDTFNLTGDVKGSRQYPAEMQNVSPRIRFQISEISALKNGAMISVSATEAYRLDNTLPPDDEFQTAEVTRIAVADIPDLSLPVPDFT